MHHKQYRVNDLINLKNEISLSISSNNFVKFKSLVDEISILISGLAHDPDENKYLLFIGEPSDKLAILAEDKPNPDLFVEISEEIVEECYDFNGLIIQGCSLYNRDNFLKYWLQNDNLLATLKSMNDDVEKINTFTRHFEIEMTAILSDTPIKNVFRGKILDLYLNHIEKIYRFLSLEDSLNFYTNFIAINSEINLEKTLQVVKRYKINLKELERITYVHLKIKRDKAKENQYLSQTEEKLVEVINFKTSKNELENFFSRILCTIINYKDFDLYEEFKSFLNKTNCSLINIVNKVLPQYSLILDVEQNNFIQDNLKPLINHITIENIQNEKDFVELIDIIKYDKSEDLKKLFNKGNVKVNILEQIETYLIFSAMRSSTIFKDIYELFLNEKFDKRTRKDIIKELEFFFKNKRASNQFALSMDNTENKIRGFSLFNNNSFKSVTAEYIEEEIINSKKVYDNINLAKQLNKDLISNDKKSDRTKI
jgi:hypothetical protein